MAGHPMAAALFLGMGIQKLSMNANELINELIQVSARISRVKKVEMGIGIKQCKRGC
jgi:phosphoenolpyruvate-protein kinase (PTS system EI component)